MNEQFTDRTSSVLDPAAVVPVSTKKIIVTDALSGLVAGLAVGLVAVTFGALLSEERPDRSTVAATLGAPVELSLQRYRSPRVMRRRRLSRQLREPSPTLRMIERRLRGQLESAPGSALAVVAVGTPEPTALAVGALALALSSEGHRVIVVDVADNRPLASILGLSPSPRRWRRSSFLQRPSGEGARGAGRPTADGREATSRRRRCASGSCLARCCVRSRAPRSVGKGRRHDPLFAANTLIRMEVTRRMLHEAGISLRSVILLDADSQDESSGALSPVDLRLTPDAHVNCRSRRRFVETMAAVTSRAKTDNTTRAYVGCPSSGHCWSSTC